jgi:hypothetical protein
MGTRPSIFNFRPDPRRGYADVPRIQAVELPRIAGDSAAHCVADESEEAREPSTTCNGGLEELTTMVVVSVVYL